MKCFSSSTATCPANQGPSAPEMERHDLWSCLRHGVHIYPCTGERSHRWAPELTPAARHACSSSSSKEQQHQKQKHQLNGPCFLHTKNQTRMPNIHLFTFDCVCQALSATHSRHTEPPTLDSMFNKHLCRHLWQNKWFQYRDQKQSG